MWATIARATQPLSDLGIPQEIGTILQGSFLLAAVISFEVVKRTRRRRGERGRDEYRTSRGRTARRHRSGDMPVPGRRPQRQRDARLDPEAAGLWPAFGVTLMLSITRFISDNPDITSSGTFGVTLRYGMPIAMCGIGGLWAERSGTVNIGLEGMMAAGTLFAGWWAWYFNWWMGLLGGLIGGLIFGLLHALATVTFGVNHIVSGFAINILAAGVTRFMAGELFADQARRGVDHELARQQELATGKFTMPFLSGGDLFGWRRPTSSVGSQEKEWLVVSDVAGMLKGVTPPQLDIILDRPGVRRLRLLIWHTPFGLRLRSSGEKPQAADSLGVRSPASATRHGDQRRHGRARRRDPGLFANRYQEGQTGGRASSAWPRWSSATGARPAWPSAPPCSATSRASPCAPARRSSCWPCCWWPRSGCLSPPWRRSSGGSGSRSSASSSSPRPAGGST